MTAAYPGTLPRPQLAGYSYDVRRPAVATASDRGCGRIRRVGLGPITTGILTWLMSDAQLATWATFWAADLAGGSLPFTLTLLTSWDDRTVTVQPLSPWVQSVAAGGRWKIELSVEWLDRAVADSATVSEILGLAATDPGLLDSFDRLHTLVHFTMPGILT